jgi:hypothetical protein
MEVIIMRIATLFAIFALMGFVASASASDTGVDHVKIDGPGGVHYDSGRVEGDTIEEAWVIGSLPFTGFDNTCGFVNNYDEICPYSGSTSGDVVYAYTPGGNETISIDLCYSLYDTKVYVYQDYWTPGAPYACNDDFYFGSPCGVYTSKIELLNISAGHTYYIVVDGYGGSCGDYQLDITSEEDCDLVCPDGGLLEGEMGCYTDYVDNWNGGCNSTPYVFQTIEAQAEDCATMCGTSCTYLYAGSSYRDTDWFEVTCLGGLVTATVEAEFPVQFIFIYGADCANLQYDLLTGGLCTPLTLSHTGTAGQIFWLWVGPSVFSGIPESDYILDVCGIVGEPTPANDSTWGSIKGMFK